MSTALVTLGDDGAPVADVGNASTLFAWMRARWSAFLGLERRIADLQHRAAVAANAAKERGDLTTWAGLKAQIVELGELAQRYIVVRDNATRLARSIPGTGGGMGAVWLIPVAFAAAIIAAAYAMSVIFAKTSAHEKIIDGWLAGTLTEDQMHDALADADNAEPDGMLGDIADIAKWLALGALAFIALKAVETFRR